MATQEELEDLYAIVSEQAETAKALLAQLARERAELAKVADFTKAQALNTGTLIKDASQDAVERAIRAALPTLTREATEGVENAAKGVLATLAKRNAEAADLQNRMERTRASLGWRLSALAVAGACGFVLAGWIAATWQQHSIESERAGLEALQANAAEWAAKAGRAKLDTCGEQGKKGRLCVRVDKAAGGFGKDSDYMVIQGY